MCSYWGLHTNGRHYRYVNNNDAVTRIPLEDFKYKNFEISYKHVNDKIYFREDGTQKFYISSFSLAFDRLKGRALATFSGDLLDGFSDHSMDEYVKCLKLNYNM